MKTIKVDSCEDFDAIGIRTINGFYELNILMSGKVIYKEKYLKGLFNKYHFISNMEELGIPIDFIHRELLTQFK